MTDFLTMIWTAISYCIANVSLALAGKVFSLLLIIWMLIAFWKANSDPKNSFNFSDLLEDDSGKIGGSKMRLNLAFIICSWILLYYSLNGTLSEWLFAAYLGAFVYDRAQSRSAESAAAASAQPTSAQPTDNTDKQ